MISTHLLFNIYPWRILSNLRWTIFIDKFFYKLEMDHVGLLGT